MPEVQPSELEEAVSALMIGADSSSAALLDYVPPKVSPCANTTAAEGGPIPNCGNEANLSCGKCHLVRNEGEMYGGDLDILFAASGDPRNLMATVNGLPNTYEGTITCVLNDKNVNVVARNIVMLLIAAQLPPAEAAEIILHMWYSARLTKGMLTAINNYVKKLVADVIFKIKDKSDKVLQSKKWTFGSAEVTVRLTKSQWKTLLAIIDAKHDLSKTEEERRKVVLAPHRLDYRERELHTLPGFRRLCSTRLLFNESDSTWLQKDSADPREGWPMQSILSTLHADRNAKNDVNGLLYFHIRSIIERFCNRLQNPVSKVKLMLYCVDAASLPGCCSTETRASGFDRIEVSNIADEAYLGLFKTLGTFTPLLKHHSVNPQATLITLFLNACEIADRQMGNRSDSKVQSSQLKQVMKYLPFSPRHMGTTNSPEMMKIMAANDLVRDYDRIFAFYMDVVMFKASSKQTGVKMRQRNAVVEPWPMRLKKKPGEEGADEEFQSLLASSSSGAERYVEWVREA
ncbi:MAG: hypothetical protein L6R38_004262 [Xanthoria sp. 2 TBL-2021]|nr:MAG: hypothetical protein L6R38_004262 [Xanthoria sp. 2 TBL-2021]